jgi:hypothetical protein
MFIEKEKEFCCQTDLYETQVGIKVAIKILFHLFQNLSKSINNKLFRLTYQLFKSGFILFFNLLPKDL